VNSGDNRIEGNLLASNNANGILVDTTVSPIVGNTARGNGTNYNIVSGNRVATIIVPATAGAIAGNVGGTAFSTDGFSNIAF
jgi:hypothetical protein